MRESDRLLILQERVGIVIRVVERDYCAERDSGDQGDGPDN